MSRLTGNQVVAPSGVLWRYQDIKISRYQDNRKAEKEKFVLCIYPDNLAP